MGDLPFIQARHYTLTSGRRIDLVVLHDMEAPEDNTRAETVARWFSTTTTEASAHFCVDPDSIVQCVRLQDVAWHAPGANHNGIGIEHAGYARQTREQWLDPPSTAMLRLSAGLTGDLCRQFAIPIEFVDAKGLVAGRRGITTHKAVSDAFKRSAHWDPGPGFPMDHYLNLVRLASAPTTAPAPPPPSPSGPTYDYEEATVKTTMVHIGPLDSNGNGWADWQPGLGRDPVIVGVVQHGPSPGDDGYWPQQAKVNLSAQPRGGSARVVVRGGTPGDTVTAWVTVA